MMAALALSASSMMLKGISPPDLPPMTRRGRGKLHTEPLPAATSGRTGILTSDATGQVAAPAGLLPPTGRLSSRYQVGWALNVSGSISTVEETAIGPRRG